MNTEKSFSIRVKKDLKKSGLNATMEYRRNNTHEVVYLVSIRKGNDIINFDDGYFIGEKGTSNTKEAMFQRWEQFIKPLNSQP